MVDTLRVFLLWFGIIFAVVIGSIIWIQNSLLFYPNTSFYNWGPEEKALERNIGEIGRALTEIQINPLARDDREIFIPGGRGGLSAYLIEDFPGKDYIVHCHGTSGNISDRKYVYDIAQEMELNLLLFDYEGYGKSKGSPSVKGILRNGISAVDFLIKKGIEANRIMAWGESLGGPVAAWIARKRPIKGAVLMATFSSMEELVRDMDSMGWVRYPLSYVARVTLARLNTKRWLKQTSRPIVVMHSRTDDYIPFANAETNFAFALAPKHFIEIGGTHISPEVTLEQIQEAVQFIEDNQPDLV